LINAIAQPRASSHVGCGKLLGPLSLLVNGFNEADNFRYGDGEYPGSPSIELRLPGLITLCVVWIGPWMRSMRLAWLRGAVIAAWAGDRQVVREGKQRENHRVKGSLELTGW